MVNIFPNCSSMKVDSKMINNMDKAQCLLMPEVLIKEDLKMMKRMEKEHSPG